MEIWNLYDENRQLTTQTMVRGTACPQNMCRLVVHVCIFNDKGEMLIQQRQKTKKSNLNAWDLTLGGCVQAGETSKQAIKRELFEELGIEHDFTNERAFLTINFDNGFDDYYLIKQNVNLDDVKFIDDEVQAVKWASKEEIIQMIADKKFINYYPSFISALFEMRVARGAFKG